MDRLTETVPYQILPTTFKRCQLCGYTSDDICEFRLWCECDENDKPEPYNILIACKSDDCFQIIKEHERLYFELSWSTGEPGHFILLCGDCPHRDGTHCTHPDLKINGGNGLLLHRAGDPIFRANICYHDDNAEYGLKCGKLKAPFVGCAGLPSDHDNHIKDM